MLQKIKNLYLRTLKVNSTFTNQFKKKNVLKLTLW